MGKKTKKVKVVNIPRVIVFVLAIYIIVTAIIYLCTQKVNHIDVQGASYYKDIDIIRITGLDEYPSYIMVNTGKLKKELEALPMINTAKVSYGWDFTIKIEIEENKAMFKLKSTDQICLQDGTLIDDDGTFTSLPILLNNTPSDIMRVLANSLSEVDSGILYMISEIEYSPSYNKDNKVIDDKRFLLYMVDSNLAYINAKNANLLNKYLDILANNKLTSKGTLYLDGDEGASIFKVHSTTTQVATEGE